MKRITLSFLLRWIRFDSLGKSGMKLTALGLVLGLASLAPSAMADSMPLLTNTLSGNLDPSLGTPFEYVGFDLDAQWLGFSFVLGRQFNNVSITLNDIVYFGAYVLPQGQTNEPGLAYLTNGIGPGATSQNTIATAPFSLNWNLGTTAPPPESITLFGNLDLRPGTYDFFLTVPYGGWGIWGGADGPVTVTTTEASGVGFMGGLFTAGQCTEAPPASCPPVNIVDPASSGWLTGGGSGPFEITGTPVPEPSTLALLGAGVLTFAVFTRRKAIL